MGYVKLPKGAIIKFIDPLTPTIKNPLTEHNRAPLSIDVERIEKSNRMANGYMRRYIVADKRTFSVSWENLPHAAINTVDGKWGGREIENWYNTMGSFILEIIEGDGTRTQYNVAFSDFSKTITKRGVYDFWTLDISLEEL